MSRPAYLGFGSTKEVVEEHLTLAENCHKDPGEFADFVDQLYAAAGPGPWDLVEISVEAMVKLCRTVNAFGTMGRVEADKTRRYAEKLLRGRPPPGALAYDEERAGDQEVVAALQVTYGSEEHARKLAGWYIIDGRHRLLALQLNGQERSRWYVPSDRRLALHEVLDICEEVGEDREGNK